MPGFYNFCWYFLIFSFVGWTLETALVSFQQKKFVNRGFLAGPICPIYGVGMCLIILALMPIRLALLPEGSGGGNRAVGAIILLVVSTVVACAVEYFVGWLLEKIFHQRWWDYSDHRFNLNGRIAIPESLAWGPLATLAIVFLMPWLNGKLALIPRKVGWAILGAIAVIIVLDVVRILRKMKTFDKLAATVREGAEELRAKLDESASTARAKLDEGADELRSKFDEGVRELREKAESARFTSAKRLKHERRLRKRLSRAYPKLGEKWRILRDDDERDGKSGGKNDEKKDG